MLSACEASEGIDVPPLTESTFAVYVCRVSMISYLFSCHMLPLELAPKSALSSDFTCAPTRGGSLMHGWVILSTRDVK